MVQRSAGKTKAALSSIFPWETKISTKKGRMSLQDPQEQWLESHLCTT